MKKNNLLLKKKLISYLNILKYLLKNYFLKIIKHIIYYIIQKSLSEKPEYRIKKAYVNILNTLYFSIFYASILPIGLL